MPNKNVGKIFWNGLNKWVGQNKHVGEESNSNRCRARKNIAVIRKYSVSN